MPAAYTVTPEPVTNSGRGWGEESAEGGSKEGRGQGSGGEHLIGAALAICLAPHTASIDCILKFGRGSWLGDDEEACC